MGNHALLTAICWTLAAIEYWMMSTRPELVARFAYVPLSTRDMVPSGDLRSAASHDAHDSNYRANASAVDLRAVLEATSGAVSIHAGRALAVMWVPFAWTGGLSGRIQPGGVVAIDASESGGVVRLRARGLPFPSLMLIPAVGFALLGRSDVMPAMPAWMPVLAIVLGYVMVAVEARKNLQARVAAGFDAACANAQVTGSGSG